MSLLARGCSKNRLFRNVLGGTVVTCGQLPKKGYGHRQGLRRPVDRGPDMCLPGPAAHSRQSREYPAGLQREESHAAVARHDMRRYKEVKPWHRLVKSC